MDKKKPRVKITKPCVANLIALLDLGWKRLKEREAKAYEKGDMNDEI